MSLSTPAAPPSFARSAPRASSPQELVDLGRYPVLDLESAGAQRVVSADAPSFA